MPPQRFAWEGGRRRVAQYMGAFCVLLPLVTGCATVDQQAGFSDVHAAVVARSGKRIVWNRDTALDAQVGEEVQTLLHGTLTADAAIQVALLNNRELQAMYADLGVAQADLVQAGLLRNPVFDGIIRFPVSGGPAELELSAALGFLDLFYLPLRQRVAAAQFDEAKLQVTTAVLNFAGTVQTTFYRHQANEQRLELLQSIAHALATSWEIAQRLQAAGNITELDLAQERAEAEAAKVHVRAAEAAVRQSREHLNTLMGLWGLDTAWQSDGRLPDVPAHPLPINELETQALRQSLDLASARQRVVVAGEQLGVTRATALVPEISLGPAGERRDGRWEVGPLVEFPIPLFDQGQARVGRALAELRRAQQAYYALGVRIRATARALRERVQDAQDRALYYRDILLPLRERIVSETQLQYNAMQRGVFDLLRAREQHIQTAVAYIDTLRDYWLARADLGLLLSGRIPSTEGSAGGRLNLSQRRGTNGQH